MKLKKMIGFFLSVNLSLISLTLYPAASTTQKLEDIIPDVRIEVQETETSPQTVAKDFLEKKMQYNIGVISNKTEKTLGSLKLEFDYQYSPERQQTEIKNQSIQTVQVKEPWGVKGEVFRLLGAGTDLAAIECGVFTSNDNNLDEVFALNRLIITADHDGNTKVVQPKLISLDPESNQKYREYEKQMKQKAKQTGSEGIEKLIKAYGPVSIQGTNITYQINEYQSDLNFLGGTVDNGSSKSQIVDDLYAKTASYEISLKVGEESIGREKVEIMAYYYSPSENYAFFSGDADQIEGYDDWVFEDDTASINGMDRSLLGSDIIINNGDQTVQRLRVMITADPKGNLSIKPITIF